MGVVFNEKLKYCIDCQCCVSTAGDEKYPLNRDDWKCLNPKNMSVDLVTGSIVKGIYHPDYLRGLLREVPNGGCGIDGKWFKERK